MIPMGFSSVQGLRKFNIDGYNYIEQNPDKGSGWEDGQGGPPHHVGDEGQEIPRAGARRRVLRLQERERRLRELRKRLTISAQRCLLICTSPSSCSTISRPWEWS